MSKYSILIYVLLKFCKIFIEGLQQQAAVVTHTEESIADLFGRNVRIPVAEPLILFADIGFDVLQLFIEALGQRQRVLEAVEVAVKRRAAHRRGALHVRDRV